MNFSDPTNPRKDRAKSNRVPKDFTAKLNKISSNERSLLAKYAGNELNLYNALIENFQSTFYRQPTLISQITEDQVTLFGQLCKYNMSVREARQSNRIDQALLVGLPESIEILFEVAKYQSAVVADTRKNMAVEILRFFITQSRIKKEQKTNSEVQEYRSFLKTISTCNPNQKYHLQIPRAICKMTYDKDKDKSYLLIPHFKEPVLSIDSVDLTNSFWNLVIIRRSGQDWFADFKAAGYGYLIKYIDKKGSR